MSGKGIAGIGIVAAAILIVWAVTNPGPEQPRNVTTANGSPGSTAFRMAGGAALGAQAEIGTAPQTPIDQAMAIEELLVKFLEESGLSASQDDIQNLVAKYSNLADQAQSFLSSASPEDLGRLLPSGASPPQIDLALLASLINANPGLQGMVESKVGDQRFARLNQLTGAPPAPAPQLPPIGAVSGGSGGLPGLGNVDLSSLDKKKDSGSFEDDFFQSAVTFQEEVAKLGYK